MLRSNENKYIYTSEEKEAERLKRLNEIYNPNTKKFLSQILKPGMKVLEVGPGVGILGCWIAQNISSAGQYVGLEQSLEQIKKAIHLAENLQLKNMSFVHDRVENILDIPSLRDKKFDVIYCRWVIAHIPPEIVPSVLESLYFLLEENGSLICEEGDVSKAHCVDARDHFQKISHVTFNKWYALTFKIELEFNLDFKLGEKIKELMEKSIRNAKVTSELFQPVLTDKRSKEILSLAMPSIKNIVTSRELMKTDEVDQLESELQELAQEEDTHINYIENTVASIKRAKF